MGDPTEHDEDKRAAAVPQAAAAGAEPNGKDIYGGLSFERADPEGSGARSVPGPGAPAVRQTSAQDGARFRCRSCRNVITGEYYTLNQHPLCPSCQTRIVQGLVVADGSFSRALGFGTVAAAAGAAVYYAVAALTGYELGIIAIVVGVVVGKAVRRGAGTRAHWSYRALGFGLTWASISVTYVPAILEGMHASAANGAALLLAFAFGLVAPLFMMVKGEIMSMVILGIGLWEGWRYSAAPVLSVDGPFRLGAKRSGASEAPSC